MTRIRIVSLLVASTFLLTLLALTSCVKKDSSDDNIAQTELTKIDESSAAESESSDNDLLDMIEKKDYGGYDFNVLATAPDPNINNPTRFVDEIAVEREKGEVINDAVWYRNLFINNKLNVNIHAIPTSDYASTVRKSVHANDRAYDLISLYKHFTFSLAAEGLFRNWSELDIDYHRGEWWNQSALENLNICGIQLFMSGSMLMSEIDDTLAMLFNKVLAEDYNVGDIYETVKTGDWTIERFGQMVALVSADLDGDSKMKPGNVLYGYIQDPISMTNNWAFSCDLLHDKIEDDGTLSLNVDSDRINRTLEALSPIMKSENVNTNLDLYEGLNYFKENTIFIYAIILRNVELMRDMDVDFGIIPYPKLDDHQENYYTHVGIGSPILTIPKTNVADDKMLADILEAMAISSHYYYIPAYYDIALQTKIARDEQSEEMLDIIIASRIYNWTYYAGTSEGTSSIVTIIAPLIKKGSANFSSNWARSEARTIKVLQEFLDNIIENNS